MYKSHLSIIRVFPLLFLILVSCIKPEPNRYGDGFLRAIPENEGVVSHNILDFVEEIDNQGLELHSFMFLRRGRVLAEGYWSPFKADINHIMYSVSKTFTSTAIGFAVKEKLLSVDDKVISFFPDDLPPVVSPSLEKMTIKHLLTMSTGQDPAPVFYVTDENWVKSFLATPIAHEPGKVFGYSSYATYMLSAILQKVSGMTLMDYLKPRLFDPLDIKSISWETDPRGINCGGWGLRIKTADMAKLGMFYLQNGKWNKKQLLPASWIKEASSVQIYQVEEPTFEQEMHDEGAQGYGYQIWRSTHNAYRADGAYGQYILVMPDQEAVFVTTAKVGQMSNILKLFWKHLFPGIMDRMLKPDDMARDFLVSKLASLQIRDPFRTNEDITPPKGIIKSYKINPNDQQISAISLDFNETGDCKMDLHINNVAYIYSFGLDSWQTGTTDRPGPYYLNPRRNVAGMSPFSVSGYLGWENENKLNMQLLYLMDGQYETYILDMKGDDLTLTISNSAEPEAEPVVVTGTLVDNKETLHLNFES